MKTRRRRINIDRYPDEELPDDCLRDGESLHVPIFMMDADQRAVTEHFDQQTVIHDQLAAHAACAGHRPGWAADAVSTACVRDAMLDRRGVSIELALTDREQAFADAERRQQWRDGPAPDNQNRNQSGQGEAQWRNRWSDDDWDTLTQASEILGMSSPYEFSYAPINDLHKRNIGLGPVGSEGDNPASATRTNGNMDAAVAVRDAAFADLQRRSENAWRGAR
jgi:hypothetical protein